MLLLSFLKRFYVVMMIRSALLFTLAALTCLSGSTFARKRANESDDISVRQAESVTFPFAASPHATVCWYKNGIPLTCDGFRCLIVDGTLTIFTAKISDEGNYTVVLEENEHCSSYQWNLQVLPYHGRDIRAQVTFPQPKKGRQVVLLCSNSILSMPTTNFTWFRDREPVLSCGSYGCAVLNNHNCKYRLYPPFQGPCLEVRQFADGCEGKYNLQFADYSQLDFQFNVSSKEPQCLKST